MSDHNNTEPKKKSENTIFKDEEPLLLDHDYDGIQELDHPLPSWWLAIFYASIVFAILYGVYFHAFEGNSLADEFKAEMAEVEAKRPKTQNTAAMDEAALIAAIKDPAKISLGKEVYAKNCAACHGDVGQGLIGPNLTDDNWLHGQGMPTDVVGVIQVGVPEKGMPPWGPILKEEDILGTVAFIRSLRGTNPTNPKEPQGPAYEYKEL